MCAAIAALGRVAPGCHRRCLGGDEALCVAGQPATASGVAILGAFLALRACRRHPGRLNTRLRTAATTSGVANYLAFCHRLRHRRRAYAALRQSAAAMSLSMASVSELLGELGAARSGSLTLALWDDELAVAL
ncbi:MAG: hypothetical protein ACI4BC_00435 [Muribaculaceae bacterium]